MSAHFTIEELTFSQLATRRGLHNEPDAAELKNLKRLIATLEQVRALVGKPITVSSGYRSPMINTLVNGSKNSAHVKGLAADITCNGITPKALALLIRESNIDFDQVINEGSWVHIGLADGVQRRECLTATFNAGVATYTKGIA